jgi:hypothetical protein
VTGPCAQCAQPGRFCGLGSVAYTPGDCVACGKSTLVLSACGVPRPALCDGPALRPTRRPSVVIADATEVENFAAAIATRYPAPDPVELAAGVAAFHEATDGVKFLGSAGRVGMLAWHKIGAQHGAIPDLDKVDHSWRDFKPVNSFIHVREDVQPDLGEHVTAMDVRGQYLAAAGTIDLGTGTPDQYGARDDTAELFKLPGYVELAAPVPGAPAPFQGLCAGDWLTHPVARYLATDLGLDVSAAGGWVWAKGNHRRWMNAWTNVFRDAHQTLTARDDLAGRYALAAVKAVYVAFLGGWLRSEKNNPSATLRPDWAEQIVGRAWANLFRGIAKADRPPVAVWRDTAYFLDGHSPSVPPGLPVGPELGKFKIDKYGPVTGALIAAWSSRSPKALRDAVTEAAA